jgi:hypothetical protein
MGRWLALRALVLLAALLVSLPAWSASANQYRCRHSGRIMTSCCCKARAAAAKRVTSAPQVQPADCCDTLRRAGASSSTAAARDAAQLAIDVAPSSTLVLVAERSPLLQLSWRAHDSVDARAGPIFLRDCRLLT